MHVPTRIATKIAEVMVTETLKQLLLLPCPCCLPLMPLLRLLLPLLMPLLLPLLMPLVLLLLPESMHSYCAGLIDGRERSGASISQAKFAPPIQIHKSTNGKLPNYMVDTKTEASGLVWLSWYHHQQQHQQQQRAAAAAAASGQLQQQQQQQQQQERGGSSISCSSNIKSALDFIFYAISTVRTVFIYLCKGEIRVFL